MDISLFLRFRAIRSRTAPRKAFVKDLDDLLRARADVSSPSLGLRWAAAGVSTVVLAMSGTAAYAYTSDDVLPEHALYPVRQGVEQVETALALSEERKIAVALKHLARRAKENELLQAKRRPVAAERIEKFENQLERIIDETENIPAEKQVKIDRSLDELGELHEQLLIKEREAAKTAEERRRKEEALLEARKRLKEKIESLNEQRKRNFNRLRQIRIERIQERIKQVREDED